MSGQPNRYANSAEMFRNQYMDALNIRANVDDFNLQANKNYKATGSLPPQVTQMIDNRTTTEILADTEKLKLNIMSELKPVMNSGTASVVVQKIQTSPVNADGSFLIWVAQNIPEIVKSLKKKYAIGIKGDAQDATNIVLFLSDMYSKIKDYTGTVKSYFDSVGDSKTGLKEGDLDALKKEYQTIIARLKTKYPNMRTSGDLRIPDLIRSTTEKMNDLFDLISSEKYKQTIQNIQGVNGKIELSLTNDIVGVTKSILELYDSLPSASLVRTLYKQLDQSLKNNNENLSVNILTEIYNLFPDRSTYDSIVNYVGEIDAHAPDEDDVYTPSRISEESLQAINNLRDSGLLTKILQNKITNFVDERNPNVKIDICQDIIDTLEDMEQSIPDTISDIHPETSETINETIQSFTNMIQNLSQLSTNFSKSKYTRPVYQAQPEDDERVEVYQPEYETGPTEISLSPEQERDVKLINEEINNINFRLDEIVPRIQNLVIKEQDLKKEIKQYGNDSATQKEMDAVVKELFDLRDQRDFLNEKVMQLQAQRRSISGNGLKKKRRGRPKGSGVGPKKFEDKIDHTKGIKPVKKYHPFGKYFVNSHKLNHGNVLSIKSKSGTNVREYPSRIVSPHLGHVIKTIIGGGVPSWNDMDKLTEDEKDYLYKVSKRAEFADKISIPTPSKDKLEKDIHEFEVCKGEIMAGNDSKELIKKFKLLIIKLSKNGTIPKREASEVMQELLELGY
jgi:uncharacterized coiled-coil DUF342 family protein